ncbi:hypothetical protein AAMO2058_000619000 [Amorphochlora amoebiformis]
MPPWFALQIVVILNLSVSYCIAARNTAVHARKGMNVEQMKRDFQKTMGAAALSGVAAMHTFPAQALVDARMNGDGAGIPLGINDSRLFFILAVVFTGIWALYASSVKTISDNDDEDSGLNLS